MKKHNFFKILKIYIHISLIAIVGYTVMDNKPKEKTMKQYDRFNQDLRHILLWTKIKGIDAEGQTPFIKEKCQHINCYVTKDRTLLDDTRLFDAIIFNAADINTVKEIPRFRSKKQKFIFFSQDSADKYPICEPEYDYFFNWTWTYRRVSELKIQYYSVFNLAGEDLITSEYFKWLHNMDPIDSRFKMELSSKRKAAAWFVDDCHTISEREVFVENLKKELLKYNLTVDVYGKCGSMQCKRRSMAACHWRLKKMYYFYLALEDSFSEDFVTDSVLYALKNYAVPIVYGGANYMRFLPPGSFLNGLELGEEKVAEMMHAAITNPPVYEDFFRWRNHYHIKENHNAVDACDLCEKMNTMEWLNFNMEYPEFRRWWNPEYQRHCHDEEDSWNYF